jgi:peroxiredoxin
MTGADGSAGGIVMSLMIVGIALPWLIVGMFVVIGCWLGFQLVHQNGRLLSHLEALDQRLGQLNQAPLFAAAQPPAPVPAPQPAPAPPPALPVGSPAPGFELPDLNGGRRRLADFRGKNLLLIFFNPRCGFCTRMALDLAALPLDGAGGAPIPLVITTGEVEENRKLVEEHGIRAPVLLQHGMEVGTQYQCTGTPMGYRVDEQGRIASELAIGAQALLALANGPAPAPAGAHGAAPLAQNGGGAALGSKRGVEESRLQRDGLPAGTPAPDFRLPLLHGGELSLSEYRGRKVLLVFSDPNCGPCDQLMPQLEQQYRTRRGVQILMVNRGEEEANRAKAGRHGLTFPIVLQRQWEISREYGKFATPIGYLIDEEGIIAREVAIGVEPILALLAEPAVPLNGRGKVPQRDREPAGRRR